MDKIEKYEMVVREDLQGTIGQVASHISIMMHINLVTCFIAEHSDDAIIVEAKRHNPHACTLKHLIQD